MSEQIHPLAPHTLPPFITPPGATDVLMIVTAVMLLFIVVSVLLTYLYLHSLPERLSHGKANKVQFEIVAILALLALFTHNHLFWIAALLLAFVQFPDFGTPVARAVEALERIAGSPPAPVPPAPHAGAAPPTLPAAAAAGTDAKEA